MKTRRPFTLLELLIVVAILAIIAGAVITSYSGLDDKAEDSVDAYSAGSLSNTINQFTVIKGKTPDNFDSLLAVDQAAIAAAAAPTGAEILKSLPGATAATTTSLGIFEVHTLTASQAAALVNAGITKLRYADSEANELDTTATASVTNEVGTGSAVAGLVADLKLLDQPNRVFDDAVAGGSGRGFSRNLQTGAQVLRIKNVAGSSVPADTANNVRLGADPTHLLVAVGIGSKSSLIGADGVGLANAPQSSSFAKENYGRYLAIYSLGVESAPLAKARLLTVVDTEGSSIDQLTAAAKQ